MASAALEWPKKNRCAGIWKSRSPAASLDPYLPKNTSNCGTYSEPDPSFTAVFLEAVHAHGLPCYCIVTLAMRVYPGLLH